MQVEVSKFTEGINDKALRPNGLPKSLIRYDGKRLLNTIVFLACFSCCTCIVTESFLLTCL